MIINLPVTPSDVCIMDYCKIAVVNRKGFQQFALICIESGMIYGSFVRIVYISLNF